MKAAWYERQGPAREVLEIGGMDDPAPKAGEISIRVAVSGVHPGDVKKRDDSFGTGMRFLRVVHHSDGAGWVDAVGKDIDPVWLGGVSAPAGCVFAGDVRNRHALAAGVGWE